jgi:hypothetical protein
MTKPQARALLAVVKMQVDGDVLEHLIHIGHVTEEEAGAFWELCEEARTIAARSEDT